MCIEKQDVSNLQQYNPKHFDIDYEQLRDPEQDFF